MDYKIESYILEFNNLNTDQKQEKLIEIENSIDNIDLYKLMDIVFKYSDADYITKNIDDILELFDNKVLSKLNELSLIKVIDLYIELFNKTILISDFLMASKNILDVMSYNISDNSYIEKELDKKKISKEEYLTSIKKELDKNISIIDSYNKTHEYLDKLQDKILIYIEAFLEKIESKEKEYLIQNINKRFSDVSIKLLKLKNNLDNVKGLEYNNLKNSSVVYESFRDTLLNKNGNKD